MDVTCLRRSPYFRPSKYRRVEEPKESLPLTGTRSVKSELQLFSDEDSGLHAAPEPSHHEALIVTSSGRYEVVFLKTPDIENDELLIQVHTAGINPIDWKSVEYNFCLPEFPWVTGREAAGIVKKVGRCVTNFKAGDRVWTSKFCLFSIQRSKKHR